MKNHTESAADALKKDEHETMEHINLEHASTSNELDEDALDGVVGGAAPKDSFGGSMYKPSLG